MPGRKRKPKPPTPKTPPGIEARAHCGWDGEWYWSYRVRWPNPIPDTLPKTLSEEFPTVEDAADFKASLRLAKRRGTLADLDRGRELMCDYADRWWADWAVSNLAERTLKGYASSWNRHLLPRLGHLQVRQVDPLILDKLRRDLEHDGVGPEAIRKSFALLQAMFRQAVRWKLVDTNPVREVEKPGRRRQKVMGALSVEQVEQMLDWLAAHHTPAERMLAELIAYTGGRPQDVLALTWGHVGETTLVYAQKNVDGRIVQGAKTGEDRSRSVELLATVRADLKAYRMLMGRPADGALVIPRGDGRPWTETDYKNWQRRHARGKPRKDGTRTGKPGAFRQAALHAQVPEGSTPYTLRHTFASLRIAEQRLSLQEIAEEMGHTVEVLSRDYAHVIKAYRGRGAIDPDQLIQAARPGRQTRRAS